MSELKLDCMGLPCPQPVLKCKETLDAHRHQNLVVEVDNAAAAENVARFLTSQGYETNTINLDNGFRISGIDTMEKCNEYEQMSDTDISNVSHSSPSEAPNINETVVFITADTLGRGDNELGSKLMQNFLLTLPEMGQSLWRIILVNSAVRFSVSGSPGLAPLQKLAQSGVSILVCGTCLEHYGLLNDKKVGETTNMLDIVTSFDLAEKVIKV